MSRGERMHSSRLASVYAVSTEINCAHSWGARVATWAAAKMSALSFNIDPCGAHTHQRWGAETLGAGWRGLRVLAHGPLKRIPAGEFRQRASVGEHLRIGAFSNVVRKAGELGHDHS